jgi:hypothetical protein
MPTGVTTTAQLACGNFKLPSHACDKGSATLTW